eukprot:COSAG01_NODE_788_length_13597_cov_35.303601_1_plen_479_part_00
MKGTKALPLLDMVETAGAIRQRARSLAVERVQHEYGESIQRRHTASDAMRELRVKAQVQARAMVRDERPDQDDYARTSRPTEPSLDISAQLASFHAFTAQRATTHGAGALHAHATRLQAVQRGRVARREKREADTAATTVQAAQRGRQTRSWLRAQVQRRQEEAAMAARAPALSHDEKVQALHQLYDTDRSGVLTQQDVHRLERETAGEELDDETWQALCEIVEASPLAGWEVVHLARLYAAEGGAEELEKAWEAVGARWAARVQGPAAESGPEPEPEPEPVSVVVVGTEQAERYLAKAEFDFVPAPPTPGGMTRSRSDVDSDLEFARGAIIEVLSDHVEQLGAGWSVGRLYGGEGKLGFFPTAYATRGTWGWPGWPPAPEPEPEPEPEPKPEPEPEHVHAAVALDDDGRTQKVEGPLEPLIAAVSEPATTPRQEPPNTAERSGGGGGGVSRRRVDVGEEGHTPRCGVRCVLSGGRFD